MLFRYYFIILTILPICTAYSESEANIEAFKKNINLTYNNKDTGLIEFFDNNNGKIIYIDNFIDTSLSVTEQSIIADECGVNIDAVVEKKIIGKLLSLPVYDELSSDDFSSLDCSKYQLILNLKDKTLYEYSAGGTGIVMIKFKGFFEVSKTFHSGPSTHYHLNEIDVPVETRLNVLNK